MTEKEMFDPIFEGWRATRSELGPEQLIDAGRAVLAMGGDPVPTMERHLGTAGSDYLMLRAYLAVLCEVPPSARARNLFETVVARLTWVDSTAAYLARIARRHLRDGEQGAAAPIDSGVHG